MDNGFFVHANTGRDVRFGFLYVICEQLDFLDNGRVHNYWTVDVIREQFHNIIHIHA